MLVIENTLVELVSQFSAREESLIEETQIKVFLTEYNSNPANLSHFAESFFFVRANFCGLNFTIGERCHTNERLWSGIVKNLMEELGGQKGKSHNQLYREFLSYAGAKSEQELKAPEFANIFNAEWTDFVKNAPLMEALSALAIYEIFDVPDYQMLLDVLKESGVHEKGLIFFRVHANAHHFEMFEDTITWLMEQEGGEQAFANASEFVFDTQRKMWLGLIECLQQKQTLALV
jgi:pyrroloquinoline quinone (PQQ) biosynthesis protein C